MVKCQLCNQETDSHAIINKKRVCQMCFAKLREGKRIYKINVLNKDELYTEASRCRARVYNIGNLFKFGAQIRNGK